MCKQRNDRQSHDGSLQEDQEQIRKGYGDFAAHDNAADFRHIDQLGDAGSGHNEPGDFALDGACNNAGQEHVGKANHNSLTGKLCFRQLQQLVDWNEGHAEKFENRCEFRNDQSDGAHCQNDRQCSKPHFKNIFQTLQKKCLNGWCVFSFFQGQL